MCDIYGAAETIAVASLLLQNSTTNTSFQSSATPHLSRLSSFLTSDAKSRLAEWATTMHINAKTLLDCSSALFLSQTVIEDAKLVLLEGSSTPAESARTLASLGLLTGMHVGDLLKLHLECADLLIDAATEGLEGNNFDMDPSLLANKMTSAVLTMQQTILDVYFLFFRTVTIDSAGNVTNSGDGEGSSQRGLLSIYQEALLKDVDNHLHRITREKNASNQITNDNNNNNNNSNNSKGKKSTNFFNLDAFVQDNQNKCSLGEARSVFDKWIQSAVQKVGKRSTLALEAMTSATDVARLQQRVWQCSTTVGSDENNHSQQNQQQQQLYHNEKEELYTQEDWEAACTELLLPKRRRPLGDKKSDVQASLMLWSTVFRAPFVRQVERLLRESCKAVLGRLKLQIIHALAAEGLTIDPETLTVSVGSNILQVASNPAPSPRIFRRTETIRSLLEAEVMDFVSDIVLPVQEGDPESAISLSQALLVQCSQLAGQVAILIRVLTKACNAALDARIETSNKKTSTPSSSLSSTNNDAKSATSENAARNALMTGLLVLGRLASLLKVKGRFLEDALSPLPASHSSTAHSYRSGDYTSEEQLRSAFEIADTDGDGVVTYNEALEAIQALAVGDASSSSLESEGKGGDTQQLPASFFSPTTTPSLSFDEFTLVCAHLLPPDVCKPADRLKACLEEIVKNSHTKWAEKLVQQLSETFVADLRNEYGLEAMLKKKKEMEGGENKIKITCVFIGSFQGIVATEIHRDG